MARKCTGAKTLLLDRICKSCNITKQVRWYSVELCNKCGMRQYRQKNKKKLKEQVSCWKEQNKEKYLQQKRLHNYETHKERATYQNHREYKKLQACPKWVHFEDL